MTRIAKGSATFIKTTLDLMTLGLTTLGLTTLGLTTLGMTIQGTMKLDCDTEHFLFSIMTLSIMTTA